MKLSIKIHKTIHINKDNAVLKTNTLAKIQQDNKREQDKINDEIDLEEEFGVGQYIVYHTHGVGKITKIEEQVIVGKNMKLFVICFEKDKMTLRVPMNKRALNSMRKLVTKATVKKVYETLANKVKIKRAMWTRRAQEYESKINSGQLVSVAEVIRELFKPNGVYEQSYSERRLYEMALNRIVAEISIVCDMTEHETTCAIEGAMQEVDSLK